MNMMSRGGRDRPVLLPTREVWRWNVKSAVPCLGLVQGDHEKKRKRSMNQPSSYWQAILNEMHDEHRIASHSRTALYIIIWCW